MKKNTDYYAILGVLPTAEDVVIRATYKALAQRYDPDHYSGSADDATRKMKNINKAYQVLSDPIKRKEYDSQRMTNNSYPEEEELDEEWDEEWDDEWDDEDDEWEDLDEEEDEVAERRRRRRRRRRMRWFRMRRRLRG